MPVVNKTLLTNWVLNTISLFGVLFVFFLSFYACSISSKHFQAGLPTIGSYQAFNTAKFPASDTPFTFAKANNLDTLGSQIRVEKSAFNRNLVPLDWFLNNSRVVAFQIIQNDTIIYQYYTTGYSDSSIVSSFSIAKSFVSAILGCAIADGYIGSVNDKVTKYLPGLRNTRFEHVKISHLLNHTSGIQYYNPAILYYCKNIEYVTLQSTCKFPPGLMFSYDSGNTQLLTIIIEKAVKRPMQDYFYDRIWKHLSPSYTMRWSVDSKKHKMVKSFCCLNGSMQDFAKLGRLYLHNGRWNGKQIIPKSWVQRSTKIDTTDASTFDNEFHWWIGPEEYGFYYASGFYGQYIIVYPKKNAIVTCFSARNVHLSFQWKDVIIEILDQIPDLTSNAKPFIQQATKNSSNWNKKRVNYPVANQ